MTRGSKDKYTAEQKRKAQRIERSYEERGLAKPAAQARAWATVNKQSGGGEKAGGAGARTPEARKRSATADSARRAAKTREGVPRNAPASLQTQTKLSLLKEARSRGIAGRSRMNKAQLVSALSNTPTP